MDDNEFLLYDRITKIQSVVEQYGEENFYISFSGGKDSTVLHYLFDLALPGNKIPRVYANTGIEYRSVYKFVEKLQQSDDRIVILKPSVNIKVMLNENGYPFKSKFHARAVYEYWYRNKTVYSQQYFNGDAVWSQRQCPKKLKYQFEAQPDFKISHLCCDKLKKEPLHRWMKDNNIKYSILGIMPDEGGQRETAVCMAFRGNKLKSFQPLVAVTKQWEDWFIEKYNIQLCELYYPPYNFERTGCKGCPFALHLQEELDTLQKYFPEERKQCEYIWKPVYEEYRRLGYRLKPNIEVKKFF